MKAQMQDMLLETDILKETLDVLKKDPGVDRTALKNREKVAIAGALKDKYSLPMFLQKPSMSKSSYYYQLKQKKSTDKYTASRAEDLELFVKTSQRYGYRRIHAL